jgi:hypothetical protein
MRKCKQCKQVELPPAAKCESILEKKGYCSVECLAGHTKVKRIAAQEKERIRNEEWRRTLPKNTRELNRRDLSWQEEKTQAAFNAMRVQQELLWFYDRGIEPYCISCQKTKMDFCCGHNKTRGSNSYLQFDEKNTFLQCNKNCNSSLSGNINGTPTSTGYLEGLKLRFGAVEGQSIIDYCDESPSVCKRTAEEFEVMRTMFYAKTRELKPLVERSKFIFEQSIQ